MICKKTRSEAVEHVNQSKSNYKQLKRKEWEKFYACKWGADFYNSAKHMDTEVVQMLLGAGADPHCEVGGKTVPDVALENKKFELSDSGKR